MKVCRLLVMALILIAVEGCAVHYGEKGVLGGYSDTQLDRYTYLLRYDDSSILLASGLNEAWSRRAVELCKGDDYYAEMQSERPRGNQERYVLGIVYCNTNFIDTRKQTPDTSFAAYKAIPHHELNYIEVNPLWEQLNKRRFNALEKDVTFMYNAYKNEKLSETKLIGVLDTFSRINPDTEKLLTEWVSKKPDSLMAVYSRAVFYHSYSWYNRGESVWGSVTSEGRKGYNKFREMAKLDLDKVLLMQPDFCPAHSLKMSIYRGSRSDSLQLVKIYEAAARHCPKSMRVHAAYLNTLQPRWFGSQLDMRYFIDQSAQRDKRFLALNALYLAEEGDQHLFKKEYEKARKKFSEAIKVGNFPYIHRQMGYVLEKLDRYVDSVESYTTAALLSPYYASVYEGLIRNYLKQGDFLAAMKASNYLLAINSLNPSHYVIQGDLFYMMRRYEDALKRYKQAAHLSSDKAVHRHKIRLAEFQIGVRKKQKKEGAARPSI